MERASEREERTGHFPRGKGNKRRARGMICGGAEERKSTRYVDVSGGTTRGGFARLVVVGRKREEDRRQGRIGRHFARPGFIAAPYIGTLCLGCRVARISTIIAGPIIKLEGPRSIARNCRFPYPGLQRFIASTREAGNGGSPLRPSRWRINHPSRCHRIYPLDHLLVRLFQRARRTGRKESKNICENLSASSDLSTRTNNGGRDRERVKKSGSFLFSFFSLLFFLRSLLGLSKSGKVRSVARTSLLLLEIPTLFPVLSYIILFCHRSPGRCWSSSSSSSACSSSLLPMLVFCSKVFRTRNRWRARKEPQRRARTRDSHEYCPC